MKNLLETTENGFVVATIYATTDEILVFDSMDDELEDYLTEQDIYWAYYDDGVIDDDDNTFYYSNYGEQDYIIAEGEIFGRQRVEAFDKDGATALAVEHYLNNPNQALPSWYPEIEGFTATTCELATGWYGRNDNPHEIINKNFGTNRSIIFKLSHVGQFETSFCVLLEDEKE